LAEPVSQKALAEAACAGIDLLAKYHDFDGRADLNYSGHDSRSALREAADGADAKDRYRADLLACLMSDAAVKDAKSAELPAVEPTPLCLLFGQGHQHFLQRFASVPNTPTPPPRGRGKAQKKLSAEECLLEALFAPWQRQDPTPSFRWDPAEDVRYALLAGDPTDAAYKAGTQHGANRLAAIGLSVLSAAPVTRNGRVRCAIPGGQSGADGFSLAWPITNIPVSLDAMRALLLHPDLRKPGALAYAGVSCVYESRRISVGKFMNFTHAQLVWVA
jgi:hypothetical protein